MAGLSVFRAFLDTFEIKPKKPATEAQIAKAELEWGFRFPDELRQIFLFCNGGKATGRSSRLQLISLDNHKPYRNVFSGSYWGLLPFLENNDSNPLCISCKSPLQGYVLRVPHDDQSQLLYRSLDEFFQAAMDRLHRMNELEEDDEDYVPEPTFDTHDLASSFTLPDRTSKDAATARELFGLSNGMDELQLNEQDQVDVFRFACDLVSDSEVDSIAAMLESKDEYVREHVLRRLNRIGTRESKEVLKQAQSKWNEFVKRCADCLTQQGIRASVTAPYGTSTVRIDPGPVWLNMEAFYSERNRPDFEAYFCARVQTLCSRK